MILPQEPDLSFVPAGFPVFPVADFPQALYLPVSSAHFILHHLCLIAGNAGARLLINTHRLTDICRCRRANLLLALDNFQ